MTTPADLRLAAAWLRQDASRLRSEALFLERQAVGEWALLVVVGRKAAAVQLDDAATALEDDADRKETP